MDRSTELFAMAQRLMPGGVNSPVRAFGAVGGSPPVIERAAGCYLFDADGRRYVDCVGSWGAMIVGHAHPLVVDAIAEAAQRGNSFGLCSTLEIELAAEIVSRVASIEKIRLVNSGTEAVMSAIRLARAATGRSKIVKFAGCYHGHSDALLVKAGSGVATLGLPDSPGVTQGAACDTLIAVYNDTASVERHFVRDGDAIAAVIVEPVAGNMGVIPPIDGFLGDLRRITSQHGALLVFDEVMTGFRVARGGAQALFGIRPDITTLGKIIGGGLPVGAYGGSAELMDQIAPAGPVYQAGTLSGNPIAMAAGLATLRQLDDNAYRQLEEGSKQLADGLEAALRELGVHARVQRVGSMLTLFFRAQPVIHAQPTSRSQPVNNFDNAARCDHEHFAAFFREMLQRGIHLPPSGYECWFTSIAHDEAVIDETLAAARASLEAIRVNPSHRRRP